MTDHLHGHHGTTVVEDRDGAGAALIAIGVAILIGFLVWLLAFSGVVFDRGTTTDGDRTRIQIEQQEEQPPPQQQQAPQQQQPQPSP